MADTPAPSSVVPSQPFSHALLAAPKFILDWRHWAAWSAPVKRPLDLRRALAPASTAQADTWSTFSHALLYLQRTAPTVPYEFPIPLGVGLLVAPPLAFVDFDDLFNEEGNAPTWALKFLEAAASLGAFVEYSASGEGAHAFLRISTFAPKRNRYTREGISTPVGVEVYTKERFAALTGRHLFPAFSRRDQMNSPADGDALLTAFAAEMDTRGAPVLTPDLPPAPLSVEKPNRSVQAIVPSLITAELQSVFTDPPAAYAAWQDRQQKSSGDSSLSAWRFHLYMVACRNSPISPLPVYELFNPQLEPAHPGIDRWREFSGAEAKRHRRYSDIQRAHALVVEEQRQLALDLGTTPPVLPSTPDPDVAKKPPPADDPANPSWAQLGLVLKTKNKTTRPIASSVNFIRVLTRHPLFKGYKIQRNKLDGSTCINREPIADTAATRFLEPVRAVLDMDMDPSITGLRDSIEVIADDDPFDPLEEYLRGLPRHVPRADGVSNLSGWLEQVGASPSTDLERFSRRILIGLVARALKPGVKFDYVPVFEGRQGIGKSTLVKALVSAPFYATLYGGLGTKDSLITLRGRWGVEISEMAGFKRTDNEVLKSFFSTDTDVFRPPYGRASVAVPRRAVLFGTTNDPQYLTDHTGARRIWPIFFSGKLNVDWFLEHRDLLFAEALAAYEAGESFHDSLEELSAPSRGRALLQRMVTPGWQLRVLSHLSALPHPHLPAKDERGHSGVLSCGYVSELGSVLDLPSSFAHLAGAVYGSLLERAGYVRKSVSYRDSDNRSTKLQAWCNPVLLRLNDDQLRAWLAAFPELFRDKRVPPAWENLREAHLSETAEAVKDGPRMQAHLDSEGEEE